MSVTACAAGWREQTPQGTLISREDEAYERSCVDGEGVKTSGTELKKTAKVEEGASNR